MQTLIHRRVPHIGALYVGGGWTFIEIVRWGVDRFVLSPHIEEVVFLGLLLMLPTVLLLAYEFGAPGPDAWSVTSLVGAGANVLVTVALLSFLYADTDLGSAQQTVQLAGLSGETVERTVPKNEFRKRVGLFHFDTAGDELAALGAVLPYAIESDLMQDLFVTTYSPLALGERLRETGLEDPTDLPLALKRDIASEYDVPYILDGTVSRGEGPFRLTTVLRSVDDLEVVAEHTFQGAALLPLIDQASEQLRRDLEIPSAHIENTPDLPVQEITTTSLAAFKAYAEGCDAIYVQNDIARGIERLEAATAEDATFALAHVIQSYGYAMSGQYQKSQESRQSAQRHQYRLVEPIRYALRVGQFMTTQKMDEAFKIAKQWTTLYPNDMSAWSVRAQIHRFRGEQVEAAESLRKVVEIDPGQNQIRLKIAHLLSEAGAFDDAVRELEAYTDAFPERADGFHELGQVHLDRGAPDAALSAHQEAHLRAPNDPDIVRGLGMAHLRLGHWDNAHKYLREAFTQASTPEQEFEALQILGTYHRLRGQYDVYHATVDSMLARKSIRPPVLQTFDDAMLARNLHATGAVDRGKALISRVLSVIDQMPETTADKGALHLLIGRYYLEVGDLETAARHIDDAERVITKVGMTDLLTRFSYHYVRGQLLAARGQHEAALDAYRQDIDLDDTAVSSRYRMAELYHDAGDLDRAEQYFEAALKRFPGEPKVNLAYAQHLFDAGTPNEAREALRRALDAWTEADPEHAPAAEARRLEAALSAT